MTKLEDDLVDIYIQLDIVCVGLTSLSLSFLISLFLGLSDEISFHILLYCCRLWKDSWTVTIVISNQSW